MPISNKEASDVVEIIWKHFDSDGNGSLDPDEIKLLLEFLCYLNDSRFKQSRSSVCISTVRITEIASCSGLVSSREW